MWRSSRPCVFWRIIQTCDINVRGEIKVCIQSIRHYETQYVNVFVFEPLLETDCTQGSRHYQQYYLTHHPGRDPRESSRIPDGNRDTTFVPTHDNYPTLGIRSGSCKRPSSFGVTGTQIKSLKSPIPDTTGFMKDKEL